MNRHRIADAASFTDRPGLSNRSAADRTDSFQAIYPRMITSTRMATRCIAPERGHGHVRQPPPPVTSVSVIIMPRLHFDELRSKRARAPGHSQRKSPGKASKPSSTSEHQINVSRRFGKLLAIAEAMGKKARIATRDLARLPSHRDCHRFTQRAA